MVGITYTPEELRDRILRKMPRFELLFDQLVALLTFHGFDEREAKGYVAKRFLYYLRERGLIDN